MTSRKRGWWRWWGFLAVAIVIVAVGVYALEARVERRLEKLGYSQQDVALMREKLSKAELEVVLENDYLEELGAILQSEEAPADFQAEKIASYMQAQANYGLEPCDTVRLVNHADFDAATDYNQQKLEILYNEYYLTRNLARYFRWADEVAQDKDVAEDVAQDKNVAEDAQKNAAETVALVNANRDRDYYSETEPAQWVNPDLMLVNKYYYLDHDFEVDVVEQDAAYGSIGERMEKATYQAFEKMFAAAQAAGYQLYVTSGYRGYEEQEEVFQSYLDEGGEEHALQYAAKPGYSEHQTGRAIDVFTPGETTTSFVNSAVAEWLAEHAHEFGFILRYPEGKENLTGYSYEPWHYRYVGVDAAAEIHRRGITLEEYVAVFAN